MIFQKGNSYTDTAQSIRNAQEFAVGKVGHGGTEKNGSGDYRK